MNELRKKGLKSTKIDWDKLRNEKITKITQPQNPSKLIFCRNKIKSKFLKKTQFQVFYP